MILLISENLTIVRFTTGFLECFSIFPQPPPWPGPRAGAWAKYLLKVPLNYGLFHVGIF